MTGINFKTLENSVEQHAKDYENALIRKIFRAKL